MLELIQPILIIGLSAIAIKLYLDNRKYRRYEIEDITYPEITTWDQDLSDQIEYAYNVKVYGKDIWDEVSLLRKNIEDLKNNQYKYTGIPDGKDISEYVWEGKIKVDLFKGHGYHDTLSNSIRLIREHKPNNTYEITSTGYRVAIEYTERYIADLLTSSRLGL
jgi:hypothetical protein